MGPVLVIERRDEEQNGKRFFVHVLNPNTSQRHTQIFRT